MKIIKVSGKPVTIPTSWVDVTVEQWLRIMQMTDYSDQMELIAALSGESKGFFLSSKDADLDLKFIVHLGWYAEPPKFAEIPIPKTVKLVMDEVEKEVKIPTDIGFKTLGQKIYLNNKLSELVESVNLALPYAFATYMMPLFTEKDFDDEAIDEFVTKYVNKMRILDVFPVGSFFLKKSLDYLDLKVKNYLEAMIATI